MGYLKKEKNGYAIIPDGHFQVFSKSNFVTVDKKELFISKERGEITNQDIRILEFLVGRVFATADQIYEYCRLYGLYYTNKVVDKFMVNTALAKLTDSYVINRFYLSDVESPTLNEIIPDDALVCYCLAVGGSHLLSNYSNIDTYAWTCTNNCKISDMISKDIASTQFYLRLLESVKGKLKYYRCQPIYDVIHNHRFLTIRTSFDCLIESEDERRYVIGCNFKDYDSPDSIREVLQGVSIMLKTQTWKKYYMDAARKPNLMIISQSEDTNFFVAQELTNLGVDDAWYMLEEQLENSFQQNIFLQYKEDDEVFIPSSIRIFK